MGLDIYDGVHKLSNPLPSSPSELAGRIARANCLVTSTTTEEEAEPTQIISILAFFSLLSPQLTDCRRSFMKHVHFSSKVSSFIICSFQETIKEATFVIRLFLFSLSLCHQDPAPE